MDHCFCNIQMRWQKGKINSLLQVTKGKKEMTLLRIELAALKDSTQVMSSTNNSIASVMDYVLSFFSKWLTSGSYITWSLTSNFDFIAPTFIQSRTKYDQLSTIGYIVINLHDGFHQYVISDIMIRILYILQWVGSGGKLIPKYSK